MSCQASRTARELQMLEGLVDCAFGLAAAFGAAAKAEADTRHSLELLEGFNKTALAVRMGIRLCMALRAPPRAAPERADVLDQERAEQEPGARRDERDRERDRDYEPVSLPKFLSTLGVVARDARRLNERLPGDAARVLPTLQGLLAQANGGPPAPGPSPAPKPAPVPAQTAGVAVLARPPRAATRHRLMGSAAPPRPGPHAAPPWSNSG